HRPASTARPRGKYQESARGSAPRQRSERRSASRHRERTAKSARVPVSRPAASFRLGKSPATAPTPPPPPALRKSTPRHGHAQPVDDAKETDARIGVSGGGGVML